MANPTTNYGWPMPTATDLVTDLPADFAAFGQPVDTSLKALNPETTLGDIAYRSATANTNTRLPIGTSGQVLAVSGGGVPAWTTTADVTPLTTKGDLFTFTTVDARLGVGTNGQTLVADSTASTGLKWATPSGGKVLQVVYGSTTTDTASTTTTYADTTLTATITPSSASSKVLVLVAQNGIRKNNGDAENGLNLKLFRDATELSSVIDMMYTVSATFFMSLSYALNVLDTPATTSATTYKTTFANRTAASQVKVQYGSTLSTIILMEIGA